MDSGVPSIFELLNGMTGLGAIFLFLGFGFYFVRKNLKPQPEQAGPADPAEPKAEPPKAPSAAIDFNAPSRCEIPLQFKPDPNLEAELSNRWYVYNGTRVLGPLEPSQIAQALFCLELDFDSECWREREESRNTIESSGMFAKSSTFPESEAAYWVFDGKTIHGPLSEADLRSSKGRERFPEECFVCKRSTTNGWIQIAALLGAPAPTTSTPTPLTSSSTQIKEEASEPAVEFAPLNLSEPVAGLKREKGVKVTLASTLIKSGISSHPAAESVGTSSDILLPVLEVVEKRKKRSA